jgi:hypothetical protein
VPQRTKVIFLAPSAAVRPRKPLQRVPKCGMARVRVSIVFKSGARIGPGKAKLLESFANKNRFYACLERAAGGCHSVRMVFAL